jgi:ABC-2 type transport system permease protein
MQREFLNRVQKKSFLIATILIPLIFPTIIGLLLYVSKEQDRNAKKEVILYIDESGTFIPDSSRYIYKKISGSLKDAIEIFEASDDFGLLYIPPFELSEPVTITLRTKVNASMDDENNIRSSFENRIKDLKMQNLHIDQKFLDDLHAKVTIKSLVSKGGQEESSDSIVLSGIGSVCGILMYMFIFIYGAQIMQGVIEEKSSKVVEVIISSVRPFQLMMGKIIGLAAVGLLQFLIWIVLMGTLTFVVFNYFGVEPPQQQAMQQMSNEVATQQVSNSEINNIISTFYALPLGYIMFCFVFYFIGGYLLYGALFAAVGSAVDSPAEAQQFMFPITIPMLISYMSLFMVILRNPHSPVSFWLSIIPFTSPIAMMGRIAFNVPAWELILSMVLLIAGFMLTTWIAARIYRVGILMHGTKVNYKVLVKWFMMKG